MVEWVSSVYFPCQIQVHLPFSLAVITAITIYLHCIIQIMHEIYVKIVKSIFLNYMKYMLCMHSKSLHSQCKYEFLIKFSIFTFLNCTVSFRVCGWFFLENDFIFRSNDLHKSGHWGNMKIIFLTSSRRISKC